jgi:hypothetical protein
VFRIVAFLMFGNKVERAVLFWNAALQVMEMSFVKR